MKELYIGDTKNGFHVFVDIEHSHAATHLKENPKLLEYVKEIIPGIEGMGAFVHVERDMGKEIGKTDLVKTDEHDEIVYAKRPHRSVYARFVKNKTPIPTNWITVILKQSGADTYQLRTAFIGRLTPSFPGGDYLPEKSNAFWKDHALVWGSQEIIPGTETTNCPWLEPNKV